MDNIKKFEKFAKRTEIKVVNNRNVMIYTRVSSKDQESNKSLITQRERAYEYAKKNNYKIVSEFGGTYESASGDMTRKEFKRLIDEIRKSKNRPYAILFNTINRFSRTGGSGVSFATELVEGLNVNLIDVTNDFSTETEQGKVEIYKALLQAKQENLDRLKHTIPGMKKHISGGNWLGKAPIGYSNYGPRVKDYKFFSPNQEIKINEDGELLKKAWNWKLNGEKDFEIRKKLQDFGLVISKAKNE